MNLGSSLAPHVAHKPRVTRSGSSGVLFPKGEFIHECLCYLKALPCPFKARENDVGLGTIGQTREGKGRERCEWPKRSGSAFFLCKRGPGNESEDLGQV